MIMMMIMIPGRSRQDNTILARGTAPTGNTAHYRLTFFGISFGGEQHHTERRRQAEASSSPSMTDLLRLTPGQLRADMEFAELESRMALAQEKAAVARRNTKLLDLESPTLDRTIGNQSHHRH